MRYIIHSIFLFLGLLIVALLFPLSVVAADGKPQAESTEKFDERIGWWRDARFGMFIHWGLYSAAGGEWDGKPVTGLSSWTMRDAKTPLQEYMKLREKFTASKFDADQYVKLAQDAGMKYIVLVSKHHEGFCLWNSKSSDYDIGSTPYDGDLVKELAEACKRRGMRFGVYYSILDWHHPDYTPRFAWDKRSHKPDFDKYISFMKIQLKELLEIAPNIDILWFDGEWDKSWTNKHGKDLYAYLRQLKPSLLINNRVDKGRVGMEGLTRKGDYAGDFGTPEQQIPPAGLPGVDWETCMTINDTWGYKRQDTAWKSTDVLLHQLIDCASKGGNYLLNIGPTADGTIPSPCPEQLRQIGRWLSKNGNAIYATTASPFSHQIDWGRCTTGKLHNGVTLLYLHVFQWPEDGQLIVPPLKNVVQGAWLLADEKRAALAFKRHEGKTIVTLGEKLSKDSAIVVVLQIKGKPKPVSAKVQAKENKVGARKPATIHVSKLGDNSDGSTWAKAYTTIQAALDSVPDEKGGHRIIIRPDTYMEAMLSPSFKGAKGSYNELIGDFDGSLGSGTKGNVVIDSGDPKKGFKSYDWHSTIRATQKGWSPKHKDETFSAIVWDRWKLKYLYATGADAGLFWDLTNQTKPFTVVVEDCVSIGRAFGGGVANCLSRHDEPITFRRCHLWALDWWGDTAGAYVRVENQSMPKLPDVVFEQCTMTSPQCALKAGNFGFKTFMRIKLIQCKLVALNFSQPHGTPIDGAIQSVEQGKLLHVDLEDTTVMGYKIFGVRVNKETAKDITYTTRGNVQAYVQFQQTVPKGFHRLDQWPVDLFQSILPPKVIRRGVALESTEIVKKDLCEITPVIWKEKLCHMECIRPGSGGERKDYYLLIKDAETGKELARFAEGYGLACALVQDGIFYAFASRFENGNWNDVTMFQSSDLKNWKQEKVIEQKNEHLFNSSVCAGPEGFVMAYESNDSAWPAFTTKFAVSKDLKNWNKLPNAGFGTNRYTACPCIRYVDGYYYVLYLERRHPRHVFETYITRSKDLKSWELSSANPVLSAKEIDEGINASDPDLVQWNGKTYLYYAVGDQLTWMNMKRGIYLGTEKEFFKSWYKQPGIPDTGIIFAELQ